MEERRWAVSLETREHAVASLLPEMVITNSLSSYFGRR
jgi:hypothetical protein